MSIKSRLIAITLLVFSLADIGRGDIRIKRKLTTKQGSYESTLYLKGKRQREEMNQLSRAGKKINVAFVEQCDLRQLLQLDLQNRRYSLYTGTLPMGAAMAFNEPQVPVDQELVDRFRAQSKGTLTEITTVIDTGERREMFGFTARHLKTVTVWVPQPKRCNGPDLKRETDGWYIDLLYGIDCSPDLSGSITRGSALQGKCISEYLFKRNYWLEHRRHGSSSLGFPLLESTRWHDHKGDKSVSTIEVLELSTEELNASLFQVPEGFVRAEIKRSQKSFLDRVVSLLGKR
ncbi:MAG: hypothetical protein JWM21_1817 [Acidobacteria bacterium]|nr:hypothetical protein [Acidobacteriota bacterium]